MLRELGSKVVLHSEGQDMSWSSDARLLNITPLVEIATSNTPVVHLRRSPHVAPSNLCYQMYTSGSTGRPKAVSLEHRNAVQTAYATKDLIPWKPDSRFLQQAGVTFDMCYFEIFFVWTFGLCLYSASEALIYNRLTEVVNDLEVTLIGTTPSVAVTIDPRRVTSLEWVYCVGEPLPQSLVNDWEGRLVNAYGPTEAAQLVTIFPVDKKVKSTVIGTPFQNTSFIVLQKNAVEAMPVLGVGELCIGGHQVARGYYKNPEKTQSSFVTFETQRFYRTGDLVRMLSNGTFEFIGRADDQVKIRGHRVELGEIDKALEASHQAIERACTQILKVYENSRSQLVAFIVLRNGVDKDNQDKIHQEADRCLRKLLPEYMVPRLFLFIDEIPLSAARKVDKRALTQELRQSHKVKTTELQSESKHNNQALQMLRQIYSQYCGLQPDQIGLDISIYQLGIDSINAIQIAQQLRDNGLQVQASDIMKNPTIGEMSIILSHNKGYSARTKVEDRPLFDFVGFDHKYRAETIGQSGMLRSKVESIRPATPLQSSMIAQTAESSGALYFNQLTYRLPTSVDLETFEDAWEALISKHEILRTGFAHLNDPRYPVAMVTYYARCMPSPVQHLPDNSPSFHRETLRFVRSATENMQCPPWQVLISMAHGKFCFAIHHALYDAHVLNILIRDLALAYKGFLLPRCCPFEEYLTNYLHEDEARHKQTAEFWQEYGRRAVASKFPLMNSVIEKVNTTKVATAPSQRTLSELARGCRESGISMHAAAQAAWGCLLSCLTGEDVVTFGTVLSGRNLENYEKMSFPMITTVPTIVNSKSTFSNIVSDLMTFNADVQRNQFVSLPRIQKLMGWAGETLFDTIFTFQKQSTQHFTSQETFEFLENDLTIEYPVSVELESTTKDELLFSLYYLSSYMPQEQARLLVAQFHFILESIIFNNDSALKTTVRGSDLHLFSMVPAKHEVLPSEHLLLQHSVEIAARNCKDKIALEFVTGLEGSKVERQSWTFEQLNQEGNKMARLLQSHGVIQGDIVAICFDKCPEATFSMLGILKAGCGFLALDPGAPLDRKKFIMEDSSARILLTKGPPAKALKSSFADIALDLADEDITQYADGPLHLDRVTDPQEMAYCLYTSGTTGTPKGCVITHENVVQVFLCFEKLYEYTDTSRWLQFASYHFDVSVMEHFWSWFVGMTVVTANRDLLLQDLAGAISTLQITHIDLTPSLARLLDPKDVPTLAAGVFVTGGEMLRRDIIEAWGDTGAIHNAYGPTEATIGVTMYRSVPKNGRPSNIGWPFHVVGILVVDPSNPTIPVLRGGIGELLLSGKLVAKGYLRREELTRQRFIEINGQKCYRTGDLVRILANGSIDFLGRADDQIKLRGQRLETGEINAVIKGHDNNIDDAVTLVLRHPKQQKEQLVSFVAVNGIGDKQAKLSLLKDTDQGNLGPILRNVCAGKLPGYMVPTHILLVNKMPLSANNKIETRQLMSLYENVDIASVQRMNSEHDTVMSVSANEKDVEKISKALSQILGLTQSEIATSSSFFELGLDSISIINFSRALKNVGFAEVNSSLLMRNPSISKLAIAISSMKPTSDSGPLQAALQRISAYRHQYMTLAQSTLKVCSSDVEAILPCTPLQAGIISRSLESSRGLYFAAFNFDLDATVNISALKQACQQVCDTVQVLRIKFIPTDDGYIQVVLHQIRTPWNERTLKEDSQLDKALRTAHTDWWKQNRHEIMRPFELVVTRTPEKAVLSLHIFHALYDGNSLPLIMRSVVSAYHGSLLPVGGPSFSEALPHGPLLEMPGAEQFWIDYLSPLQNASLTKLQPLSSSRSQEDTSITYRIEPIDGFEACRRKLNVTHQAMLQACWAIALQDVMSGPLVIGLIVSGRSIDFEGADTVVGPLFNTIPFFLTLTKDSSWSSIISRAHDFNSAALVYQHTPLRDIQRWTRANRTPGTLFDTLFVFQKDVQRQTIPNPPWTLRDETFEADYPISFEVLQTLDGGFNLTLACQASMSNEEASRSLIRKFEHLLLTMIKDVHTSVLDAIDNDLTVEGRKTVPYINKTAREDANGLTNGHVSLNHNGIMNGNGVKSDGHMNGNSIHAERHDAQNMSPNFKRIKEEIVALANVENVDIHVHTSIFEVGLDSIDAVKLSSRLKKATGVYLPVSQIMKLLTVSRIAAAIDEKRTTTQPNTSEYDLEHISTSIEQSLRASGVNLAGVEKVLPCTPLQESMVADMLNSDFERYLNFDVLKLDDNTDVAALNVAWVKVVNALPILRSRFMEITDPNIQCTIAQLIVHPSTTSFKQYTSSVSDGFSKVFSAIREDVRATFTESPALRLTLVKDSMNMKSHFLILALPHAMYDGWSLRLVHDLVNKAYHGASIESQSYSPALASILHGSNESSLDFWRQALGETNSTLFPQLRQEVRTVHRTQKVSQQSLAQITAFCKRGKFTVAALCQSIWSIVLAHHTQQLDVSFAQVLSGRTDETTKNVVFPTMNTVISRAVLHGTRVEMVQYVQHGLSAISEHQHFPLRKALTLIPSKGSKDVFNTLFIFQRTANEVTDDGTQLYQSVGGASNVEYPVCVEAETTSRQLIWRSACEQAYLNESEIDVLLERLDQVLEAILSDPGEPVVNFEGQEVQLCSLPPIVLKTQHNDIASSESAKTTDQSEDQQLSAAEKAIREVVARVAQLDVEEVQKESSLFGLGLDSISTIKVSSLLRKKGFNASVNDILAAGSIGEIARIANAGDVAAYGKPAMLDARETSIGNDSDHLPKSALLQEIDTESLLSANGIEPGNVEQLLPCSAGQMLLLSRWQNEGVYYSALDFSATSCEGIDRLKLAWKLLVEQNPMLRTIFVSTGKRHVPVIQAALEKVEACFVEVPSSSNLQGVANGRLKTSSEPVNPPCVLFAQKTQNNQVLLALKISHALYDGFSLKMLISSLQNLANDLSLSPHVQPYNFADYLATLMPSDAKRRFWTDYLSNLNVLPLPRVDSKASIGGLKQLHVVKADVFKMLSALRTFARKHKVSTQSLFLASYSITHAHLQRQKRSPNDDVADVLIGLFMANRSIDGIDELAAPTLGFAPVRVRQPLNRSLVDIARGIQDDMRDISEDGRGQVGLWELQEWIGEHVKVDIWVNILRQWLPDTSPSEDKGIQIVNGEKSEDLEKEYSIVRMDDDIKNGLLLKDNVVRGSYDYPMMDLEATFKDDSLDVGVHAPSSLVTFESARRIIQDVAERLSNLVSGSTQTDVDMGQ